MSAFIAWGLTRRAAKSLSAQSAYQENEITSYQAKLAEADECLTKG